MLSAAPPLRPRRTMLAVWPAPPTIAGPTASPGAPIAVVSPVTTSGELPLVVTSPKPISTPLPALPMPRMSTPCDAVMVVLKDTRPDTPR